MPCDKTTERSEGTIGFWDHLMGNYSPFEDESPHESVDPGSSPTPDVWYFYRINPTTRDVEYQFPPSENWSSYP